MAGHIIFILIKWTLAGHRRIDNDREYSLICSPTWCCHHQTTIDGDFISANFLARVCVGDNVKCKTLLIFSDCPQMVAQQLTAFILLAQ